MQEDQVGPLVPATCSLGVRLAPHRPEMVGCGGEADFLAKLYGVRLAFSELLRSQANRDYFQQLGRDIVSSFLESIGQDSSQFRSCYDNLLGFLGEDEHWKLAEEELRARRVGEGVRGRAIL